MADQLREIRIETREKYKRNEDKIVVRERRKRFKADTRRTAETWNIGRRGSNGKLVVEKVA